MKKSMMIALSGLFVVVTIMLCTNTNKVYEKKKYFSSPNEIIDIINHKQLGALNKDGVFVTTSDFKECLSKRKRVTDSNFNYYKIDGEILPENNTEDSKKVIVDNYKNGISRLEGYTVPEKLEVLTLTGIGYSTSDLYIQNKEVECSNPENIDINIVFIDEGEGWVIDYFWISTNGGEDVLYNQ
ncbi:MAG: hypothetical protein KIC66_11805 [Clostridium sp.]|uniref:hypothetical protein n=1 Tax=Clostridium sp. TaxID=1506 RepID=UPI0025C4E7B9|nr:hypothetical protein [Clostridium sp.]MBS5927750.1 hypothetical protein [Clostridium sp.]